MSARLLTLALLASLVGCDGKTALPTSTSAGARPYSLVTQQRPESLEAYLAAYKSAYELCETVASQQKLPVQPFITLPANFVIERTTYHSDGVAYYYKQQSYALTTNGMVPERGCATRIVESAVIERARDGKVEHVDVHTNGKRKAIELPQGRFASAEARNVTRYSVARTENGIAMRCLPASALVPGVISADCIIDDGAGDTLRDVDGRPLPALSRNELTAGMQGVILCEPVSVKIGKVDATVFTGELK